MKKILVPAAIGAVVGAALLPVYFLLVNVFGFNLYFSDWAFFLGLPLLLIGLLILLRGGASSRTSTAFTNPGNAAAQIGAAIQANYDADKAMSDPKVARRERGPSLAPAGVLLVGAGVVDIIVALISNFFIN